MNYDEDNVCFSGLKKVFNYYNCSLFSSKKCANRYCKKETNKIIFLKNKKHRFLLNNLKRGNIRIIKLRIFFYQIWRDFFICNYSLQNMLQSLNFLYIDLFICLYSFKQNCQNLGLSFSIYLFLQYTSLFKEAGLRSILLSLIHI